MGLSDSILSRKHNPSNGNFRLILKYSLTSDTTSWHISCDNIPSSDTFIVSKHFVLIYLSFIFIQYYNSTIDIVFFQNK